MYTFSGRSVYSEAGSPSLEDIARGLSRTCRFSGQVRDWYCVLAHTFTVAALVAPEYRIHALLHDAPESIVSDVVTSWKSSFASFNEKVLLDRIYYELGIENIQYNYKAQAAVKRADRIALMVEADMLGHSVPNHSDFLVPHSREELEIARDQTGMAIDAGPLSWINLDFADGYIEAVKEEILNV